MHILSVLVFWRVLWDMYRAQKGQKKLKSTNWRRSPTQRSAGPKRTVAESHREVKNFPAARWAYSRTTSSVQTNVSGDSKVKSGCYTHHYLRIRKKFTLVPRSSQSEFFGESYGHSTNVMQCSQVLAEFWRKFKEGKKILPCEAKNFLWCTKFTFFNHFSSLQTPYNPTHNIDHSQPPKLGSFSLFLQP